MTSTDLYNAAMNEKREYDTIVLAVKMLRRTVDKTAERCADANAKWHDDPEKDDYAEHHAPAETQFRKQTRDKAILELVKDLLKELS